jgi:hypothetical protein
MRPTHPRTRPSHPGRQRAAIVPLATGAALAALSLVAGLVVFTSSAGAYVNPFGNSGWEPARIDMGVDFIPTHLKPVRAIGVARILGSDSHSGWPGKHYIWYELLTGDHKGEIIYVAENLRHLAPVGKRVHAGQKIAMAVPHSPWTEWGWAHEDGRTRASPCYKEGKETNSGKTFARFMHKLGAPLLENPGHGSSRSTGPLC